MRFGRAVHTKGLGSALVSATKRLMASSRSATDRNTPRLRRRFVSLAKKPSTALSHDAEVGVKWIGPARMLREPFAYFRVLVSGVVVNDRVDRLSLGKVRVDVIEKAEELLMPVALHVATDDGAVENVEGGEQGGCAVAFVVVGHRPGAARLHRQSRLGAVEGLDLALLV